MPTHRRLLVVVADGEHARYLRAADDNVLRIETTIALALHPLTARRDGDAKQKADFAHHIAGQLNDAAARGTYNALVIVAPARTLLAIRETLRDGAESRIIGTLAKDLTGTPDNEIWPHLRDWVGPPHRSPS